MDEVVKKEFGAKKALALGKASGGSISNAEGYDLDEGRIKVFVKHNEDHKAKVMFEGEYLGLLKISETKTIRVPKPHKVLPDPNSDGWIFITEYIENMESLHKHKKQLGQDLARLHLHNPSLEVADNSVHTNNRPMYVDKFGFESPTCCGFIPMCNEWKPNWLEFFASHRLQPQIDLVMKKYGDREAMEQWRLLERKLPSFFEGVHFKPSLLHGDLWTGNAAETDTGPVVFDPAAFYGHSELDLAITYIFGGFGKQFYDSYHSLIPKAPGFETRQDLYQLFHYLNNWNHFGSSYRHRSIHLMRKLIT